jgi:hypothetical protein
MPLDLQPVLDVQPAAPAGLDLQPVAGGLDLQPVTASPLKLDAYTQSQMTGANRQMAAGSDEFLRAVANDPKGFVKSLPGNVLQVSGAALAIPYQLWSHGVQAAMGEADPGSYPGETQDQVNKYLDEQSKAHPVLATLGKISKGVAETAPMMAVSALPQAALKLITRGFTADMLYHAPQTVAALFAEWSKPKDQQDPAKITSLFSAAAQQIGFGALGAGHEAKAFTAAMVDKYVPTGQGLAGTRTATAAPAKPPTATGTETFSEFGDDQTHPLGTAPQTPMGEPVPPPNLDLQPVPPVPASEVVPATPATDTTVPAAIADRVVSDMAAKREPVPVNLLTAAGRDPKSLWDGYALNAAGTHYEYTPPEVTPAAPRAPSPAAQENAEALKGLSGAKLNALDVQPVKASEVRPEIATPLVPVEITPEEYTAARQGLPVGAPVALATGLAKDAKRAQLFADTANTERPGATEPLPANQLFVGDEFKLNGQPVKVEEQVADAETGQPSHVRVSGAYGEQTIPAEATVHLDKGTLQSPTLSILDKLDALKMNTAGQLHAFGLVPEVWNTLIEGVKLAVKGGMAIKVAIEQGIAKLKTAGNVPKEFDEAGAREHLTQLLGDNPNPPHPAPTTTAPERATGIKLQAATGISDEAKAQISQWVYQKRTNAVDATVADGLVKQFGVDAAIDTFNHPPAGFPEAVRSHLIRSIGRELAMGERLARDGGHNDVAAQLAQKAGHFWDDALARSTELAQGLQAMRAVTDFSPEAVVARTRLEIEKAAQTELNKVSDQITAMKQALTDGKTAGVEAVKRDAEVNTSARAAVDVAVKDSPEVHRAVVMELAPVWAQVPHILDEARRIVGAKANDILQKAPRPPGLSAGQHFRAIADDLAARAAGIFAGHIQGAEPGVPLLDKLMQRLGIDRPTAVKLAGSLSKEWDAQLKLAKDKLDKRIAMQRARQLKREAEAQTDPLVDQAIRRQLRELNQRLGDAIRTVPNERDALGRHIADRVVEKSGLKGDAADRLKASLQRRWDALVSEGQKKALDALANRAGVKVNMKLRSAFDKLVEIDRLGGLSDPKFLDTVKTALKLKQLTPADAAKLKELVTAAQAQPEGFLRDQAAGEVLKLSQRLKGDVTAADVPMAIFYANVLSGITTPAKIAFENMNLLASSTVASFLARPAELMNPPDFVRSVAGAYRRGIVKGGLQAAGTLRSGTASGIWETAKEPGVLEMKPFGERMEPFNFWKWFTRGIGVAHELTFKPSWEIRQTMLAREVARNEGLSGNALHQRVADLLANTPETIAKARAQALTEIPGGNRLDVARRTNEILERVREENMPGSTENARDFALRTAYLNEPYGMMGTFAMAVRSGLEKMRREFPVTGTAAKTQIPFTTVVANILNEKLNWTPVGLLRAAISHKTKQLYGRDIVDANERAELYAKALVGTAVIGATAELFGQHIHGNGPSDPNKRKQLQAAGWIPHSIEYNGRYFSYMNTPAALGLAILGNTMDWQRYGHGTDADALARFSFVTKATAQAIVSQGMLDSLKRFFDAIGSEDTSDGASKLEKLTARTASSFVIPNLVQQADRFFDPTVYDATGTKALVLSQIPFVRREGQPVLNVLGEPVQSAPFHYWESKATDDAVWRVLVAQQAFVPTPAKEQILGKKNDPDFSRAMTSAEYYQWIAESGPAIREKLTENLDVLATSTPKAAQALVHKISTEQREKFKPQF